MNIAPPFLVLNQPCDSAISWVARQLADASLSTICTFDLKDARTAQADCFCPVHSAQPCDCRIVVLLIYDTHHQPASLVVHGRGRRTSFSLVDTPQQRANPRLEKIIVEALASPPLQASQ